MPVNPKPGKISDRGASHGHMAFQFQRRVHNRLCRAFFWFTGKTPAVFISSGQRPSTLLAGGTALPDNELKG
jgi:hypothetical protein